MKEAFGWDAITYAWFGGYPGSASLINHENRWKEYIRDEKHGRIIGVEVKSSQSQKAKGLNAFKNRFNPHRTYVIDNKALTWEAFLSLNPTELF